MKNWESSIGSLISRFLALVQAFGRIALPRIQPELWVKCVWTILSSLLNLILKRQEIINNSLENVQFPMELDKHGKIIFLGVLGKGDTKRTPETTKQHKPTHANRTINWHSNQSNNKQSCIRALFKRAKTHSSTKQLRRPDVRGGRIYKELPEKNHVQSEQGNEPKNSQTE